MDGCRKVFQMDIPEFDSLSSKSQSVAEIHSVEAEDSCGGRNRRYRYSCDVTFAGSNGMSDEYASERKRSKSAEPRLVREAEISNDVPTDIDSCSLGTYLVVPSQGQTLKTTAVDEKSPSFIFCHSREKLSLGHLLPSHDSLSETPVDIQTSADSNVTDWPDNSKFQVLEGILQHSSTPGVRDGFITPQEMASVDKTADSNFSSDAGEMPQQFASSDDLSDSATNEHLFWVQEEHVAQQRKVSVEREQCVTKEKAAMSEVKGSKAASRHHRAVTVSRSQTWSFRDKTKSDQLLRNAQSVKAQRSKLDGSNEQLLAETSACGFDLTANSCSALDPSKTLPHVLSSQTGRPSQLNPDEPPVSSAVQSCLLKDYDKDEDWLFVPWTDEPGNK